MTLDHRITESDQIVVLEAMKMQTSITSEVSCTVSAISVTVGQTLQVGDKIIKIDRKEE
jgi:biotin carboxyl carrier protein